MSPTRLPTDRAAVVVVGGGVIGASVAWHLVDQGASDVTLVERDDVAQATSAAGAGFVGQWAAGVIAGLGAEDLAIERYALDFYRGLSDRGNTIGFRQDGCLWTAASDSSHTFLAGIAGHPDAHWVDPDDVARLTGGIIPADGVVEGVLQTANGQVSARHAAVAIAREFADRGGDLRIHRPVTRIDVRAGRVHGVDTLHGRIDTDTVVLAAGAWTNELLREHGVFAPMAPLVAARIVTGPMGVPATIPTLYLLGFAGSSRNLLWVREEAGGLLWGAGFASPPRELFVDADVPARFDQLPMGGVRELEGLGAAAASMLPLLGRYDSWTTASGAPCFTTDARGLVGSVPGVEGLYVAGGCNETGITHAPGWGRALARLILGAEGAARDVAAWRLDRFPVPYRTARAVLDDRRPWREVA